MATESKYQVGDTVQLNSGSPILTISRTELSNEGDWVEVMWFKEGEFHIKTIDARLLSESQSGLM
ncbi:MAG: DUF2158 domain-containing protein [Pedobacter sp.]|nr:MAG: DUF2158 domain-containing protein [Pedobacter sp.]